MLGGYSRYKHVGIDVPLLEEVSKGFPEGMDTAKVVKHVLNDYLTDRFQEEEAEDLWDFPMKNGNLHKNVNIYPELLADVLTAFRERHDTAFGSHAAVVRYVLTLAAAHLRGRREKKQGGVDGRGGIVL